MTPATALELRAPDLSIGELERRVKIGDAAWEHDPCFALVQVVMLPPGCGRFSCKGWSDGVQPYYHLERPSKYPSSISFAALLS